MSNEINSFDCDAAVTALAFMLEELALLQRRDADHEREVDSLERRKFRLEARLRAVQLKIEQVERDAARQESATLRDLEREADALMQEVSKSKEDARELEQQFAQVEAKCEVLEKQNADLRCEVAELERAVEELKSQDTDSVTEGFNIRKLLQELRFEVAQLEQEQRELCEAERQSMIRLEALLAEDRERAEHTRRLGADIDALRLALIEARARSSCGIPLRKRRRTSEGANGDSGAKRAAAAADYSCHMADDVQRDLWEHQEQRRRQLWDDIVRMRAEYADMLKRAGYREARNVAVQTDPEPAEDHPKEVRSLKLYLLTNGSAGQDAAVALVLI
ncbi:hypothetical protein MTO96_008799 [Rhipicephalus appendiculatus]